MRRKERVQIYTDAPTRDALRALAGLWGLSAEDTLARLVLAAFGRTGVDPGIVGKVPDLTGFVSPEAP